MQLKNWKRWSVALAMLGSLAACGGDNGDDEAAPVAPPPTKPDSVAATKVLFVGVDGATYDAWHRGVADKSLPGLAQLTLSRAWTGGVNGAPTQQPTLPAPGWATLLTGQWADQHGVRADTEGQVIKSATLFARLKQAKPALRSAAAFNSTDVAGLFAADGKAGNLLSLSDCAGADDCVASQARDRINEGYDVVVAQFGGPARVAAESGFGAGYDAELRKTDAAVAALLKQIAERRAQNPKENWLLVATSAYGLGGSGRPGAVDSTPVSQNKTVPLAMNIAMLGGRADDASYDGRWDSGWYDLPSAADVAPTVLGYLGALPAADKNDLAGSTLSGAASVRRTSVRTSMDNKRVALSWVRLGDASGEITITRDGAKIATLPATATQYEDSGFTFTEEGTHVLNYGITLGGVTSALRATVVYVKPPQLLASLRTGLTMYFPFEGDLADKAVGGGSIVPFDGVQAPVFKSPGVFGKTFQNERSGDPVGAFKWQYPAGLLTSTQVFTIGFWYQSDGTANDRSILGNKDYNSGGNPGITIAQWSGPELRFNLAGGGSRVDVQSPGMKFTPNKPVYIAMVIDKPAKTMTAYVYDSELGFSKRSVATGAVNFAQIAGSYGPFLGLNEDGTGKYGVCCAGTKGPYTMYFDDLAFWSRALTEDEVKSLALSGKSMFELFP